MLGLVQGLTEFFPVSSSGHLAIVPWAFGWDDFGDNETLARRSTWPCTLGRWWGCSPTSGPTSPATACRPDRSPVTRRPHGLAPAGVGHPRRSSGALLSDTISRLDDEIGLIAVMLIAFGLILYAADRLPGRRKADEFRFRDAAFMGLGQALALEPGVSRSGVTVSVARKLGFDNDAAARLSFLMSLPIIAGAGLFAAIDVMTEGGSPPTSGRPSSGDARLGDHGLDAVWATLRIVRTMSFTPFVIYRVGLGVVILVALAF